LIRIYSEDPNQVKVEKEGARGEDWGQGEGEVEMSMEGDEEDEEEEEAPALVPQQD